MIRRFDILVRSKNLMNEKLKFHFPHLRKKDYYDSERFYSTKLTENTEILPNETEEYAASREIIDKVNSQIKSINHGRLFAVIYISGRQYVVTDEDLLVIKGFFPPTIGDQIQLEKVLMIGSRDFSLFGRPLLPKDLFNIKATIVEKSLDAAKVDFNYMKKILNLFYINSNPGVNKYKLILVNNREEFYSRPTENAHWWVGSERSILAGKDADPVRAGGTWLGITKSGRIGCLLNIFRTRKEMNNPPKAVGRGFLVVNYLKGNQSPDEYVEKIIDSGVEYDLYNLILLDFKNMNDNDIKNGDKEDSDRKNGNKEDSHRKDSDKEDSHRKDSDKEDSHRKDGDKEDGDRKDVKIDRNKKEATTCSQSVENQVHKDCRSQSLNAQEKCELRSQTVQENCKSTLLKLQEDSMPPSKKVQEEISHHLQSPICTNLGYEGFLFSNKTERKHIFKNGTYGFGNCSYETSFKKVEFAKDKLEKIIDKYGVKETEDKLIECLFHMMEEKEEHYPDPVLAKQGQDYPEEFLKALSSICVNFKHNNYGTRTTTIILVDANDEVLYHEKTMKTPSPSCEEYVNSQFKFKIKDATL